MIEFRIDPSAVPIVGVAGPVPSLRIQGYPRGRFDEPTNQREPSKYIASGVSANVSIGDVSVPFVTVESGLHYGSPVGNILNQDLKCLVQLPRYLLDAIEHTRENDLKISVSIELRYYFVGGAPHEMFQSTQGYMQLNISQKQWHGALAQMGYASGWVIEVERPQVEGWGQVAVFLDKAADRISSRDAEGAISQCRAAWNSLDPLLEATWPSVATEVDRGSKPEVDFPPKAERARSIRSAVRSWSNTGAHPESYAATMDDALLAYRLTMSLMSFLSRKSVQAEAHEMSKVTKS